MKPFLLAMSFLIVALPALAASGPEARLGDPQLEARAHAITAQLRCVVCASESVADSNADIARDIRALVRRRILAGQTDAEILAWLRAHYGDYILLKPPLNARTYALWYAPVAALVLGLAIILASFKRKRRRKTRP